MTETHQHFRKAALEMFTQLREDEHKPVAVQAAVKPKARSSGSSSAQKAKKQRRESSTPADDEDSHPGTAAAAEPADRSEAASIFEQLLSQWSATQSAAAAAAAAEAAAGAATGVDPSQLDLAIIFSLVLGAARVLDSASKQMKPANMVSVLSLRPCMHQCRLGILHPLGISGRLYAEPQSFDQDLQTL